MRSSVLIETHDQVIVIDTGPDFRQQMLNAKVKKVDAVLFTHEHRDHIAGLDDIRSFNYRQRSAMNVYCERRVERALTNEFPYIFAAQKYPGAPDVKVHLIENEIFYIGQQKIIPVRLMHLRLPVLGFRINDFAYLTDANHISEIEKEKLRGVKYLVVNALRKEKHISHFNLEEAINLITEINPVNAWLTHIGHMMGLYSELEKELPEHIRPAIDGLVIDV